MAIVLKEKNLILTDNIKRLFRRNAHSYVSNIVNKARCVDLASIFKNFSLKEQKIIFQMIKDINKKGELFTQLEDNILIELAEKLDKKEVIEIFEILSPSDSASLLSILSEEFSNEILYGMKKEGVEKLERLLQYKDDTAGGIMNTDFIAVSENLTAKETIELIQKNYHDVEVAFYVYVVDDYGKLVGVSSLRQLVVEKADTLIKEFMTKDFLYVSTAVDQEEVARIVARYDILAVPVIDDNRKLVGVVTVDDVIDIFREEANEDFLKMAGLGDDYIETQGIFKNAKRRLPWLFASCLGGILSSFIIGIFENDLANYTFLAAFIPVIMGMGGNIGIQSTTIVVRGIATNQIVSKNFLNIVLKELLVGLLLGVIFGLIVGAIGGVHFNIFKLVLIIGIAVVCSMSLASCFGALFPLVLFKVNVDPAIATGPFITTLVDIISVFLYFTIASKLLIGL